MSGAANGYINHAWDLKFMFVVPAWVNYGLLCGVALYAILRSEYEEKIVAIY
jgi:hypothetical protein